MFTTKTRRFGIALRIALLAWVITLVTVTVFVTVIIPEQERILVDDLNSKAKAVAVSLHDVTTGAVVNQDYATLVDRCVQMIKDDKSIDYLVITKNTGESWIHDSSGWRYDTLPAEWHPEKRESSGKIDTVPEFKRRVFRYSHPFDYSGIQWGWIHVGLSLQNYDSNVATVYLRTGVLAFVCILLSFLASVLYARLFVQPIKSLQAAVRRIARGDLSARAVVRTGDELELLADSFNAMAGSLLQRDKILGSVQFASQQFLAASNWRTVAEEVLTRIGQAADVSRAHIFENHSDFARELFEYAASDAVRLIGTPAEPKIPWHTEAFADWELRLHQGKVYFAVANDCNAAVQAFLASQKTQSLILVPVRIDGAWWGHVGFDDCARARVWTDAEVDGLRALADMLGAAISRQRFQDALLDAKQTLEQRVNERTLELQQQVEAKEQAMADLAETQRELIIASREAGMAEVATGVLHNVGNVLNSVNVSTTLIREKLQRSEIATLCKLRDLLQKHEGDTVQFLTTDPKGKMVPRFIIDLSAQLEKEWAGLSAEHKQLAVNVEHIKEIVSMQQSYARVSGFLEKMDIAKLLDDALQMNTAGFARHGITIVREYTEVPSVIADKHKVLQILVNLVHNAKYALDEPNHEERRLTVGIHLNGNQRVRVLVKDNGVGIPQENLTRIFSHGFTTRKNGHGFGLHSGANAAREMGGQLTAYSDGPGKGATFVLELPLDGQRNN